MDLDTSYDIDYIRSSSSQVDEMTGQRMAIPEKFDARVIRYDKAVATGNDVAVEWVALAMATVILF
jgi:hypothetical protein